LALHVRSLEASIAFYERYTDLRVMDRHSDAASTGMEVVWLSDRENGDALSFVLVLQAGSSSAVPGAQPQQALGPISHLGFGAGSREEVDEVAAKANENGLLKFGPRYLNPYAGYLCMISDPDGHMVEFSHAIIGKIGDRAGSGLRGCSSRFEMTETFRLSLRSPYVPRGRLRNGGDRRKRINKEGTDVQG
jgi:catechol 2,3-dioxygenase-like lactoylglutathione lyase family enzyme